MWFLTCDCITSLSELGSEKPSGLVEGFCLISQVDRRNLRRT